MSYSKYSLCYNYFASAYPVGLHNTPSNNPRGTAVTPHIFTLHSPVISNRTYIHSPVDSNKNPPIFTFIANFSCVWVCLVKDKNS